MLRAAPRNAMVRQPCHLECLAKTDTTETDIKKEEAAPSTIVRRNNAYARRIAFWRVSCESGLASSATRHDARSGGRQGATEVAQAKQTHGSGL